MSNMECVLIALLLLILTGIITVIAISDGYAFLQSVVNLKHLNDILGGLYRI